MSLDMYCFGLLGTRYPSASKSVGFKRLADRLKGVKLPGFEWIKDWVRGRHHCCPSDAAHVHAIVFCGFKPSS